MNSVPGMFVVGGIFAVIAIATIGIFEANAVQFGMDQLMEASSAQLSSFTHWYYWSMHLGQQILFIGTVVYWVIFHRTKLRHEKSITEFLIRSTRAIVLVLLWMCCVALATFVLCNTKKAMYIAKTGINPFKQAW